MKNVASEIITYINKIKKLKLAGCCCCEAYQLCRKQISQEREVLFTLLWMCVLPSHNHFDLCAAFYDLKWGCTHSTDKFPAEHVSCVISNNLYFVSSTMR